MISKYIKTTILLLSLVFLSSCAKENTQDDLLSGITLRDIAPAQQHVKKKNAPKFTVELLFVFLDLNSDIYTSFQKTREEQLHTLADVRANIAKSNGISILYANRDRWDSFAKTLDDVKAKRVKTITLVVFDSRGDNVKIQDLTDLTELFYLDSNKQLTGQSISGTLNWRVVVSNDSNVKGLVNLSVSPVIVDEAMKRQYAARTKKYRTLDFAKFNLKIGVGDFVVISPESLPIEPMSPGRVLFPTTTSQFQYQSYIIYCRSIKD